MNLVRTDAGPLYFDQLPSGRLVARFGSRPVGEVVPYDGPGRVKAWWRMTLPDHNGFSPPPVPKAAISLTKAQFALAFAVEQWFAGAGPEFSDLVRRMRVQRDQPQSLERVHGF